MKERIKYRTNRLSFKGQPKKHNYTRHGTVLKSNGRKLNNDKAGKTKGGFLRGFAVLLCLSLICLGSVKIYNYVTTSPKFALKYIEIKGDSECEKDEVLRCSQVQVGINIFKLDMKEISSRLKLNYQIHDVDVSRKLPGTLVIILKKREPIAYVGDKKIYQIDAQGVLYAGLLKEPKVELPVITGYKMESQSIGKKQDSASMIAVLSLLKEIFNELQLKFFKVDIEDVHDIKIYLAAGTQIYIGSDDFHRKARKLKAIFTDANEKNKTIKSIDLRFRDEAAVTFKS